MKQYAFPSPWLYFYIFCRLLLCPFNKLLNHMPEVETVLDFGCGSGLWLNLLNLRKKNIKQLYGVDIDKRKLGQFCSIKSEKITLLTPELHQIPPNSFDCITILDVFYLISSQERIQWLKVFHHLLKPKGTLIIKDVFIGNNWKTWVIFIQEFLAVKIFKITSGKLHWFSKNTLLSELTLNNFKKIEVINMASYYPYPHFLCLAKK